MQNRAMRKSICLLAWLLLGCDDPDDGDDNGDDTGDGDVTNTDETDTATDDTDTGTNADDGTNTDTGTGMCGQAGDLGEWPTSGFVIQFETAGERAHVWVDSQAGIEHVAGWLDNTEESLGIPGGPIELNGTYNPGYTYRLQPDAVAFGDVWIELCDAAPCYIESFGPAEWMESPGTWCPWGFAALEVWDCRDQQGGGPCPTAWP